MAALTCASCGKVLVGNGRPSRGKVYCPSCYEHIVHELEEQEALKEDLYKYIKKIFVLTEIPAEVPYAVEKLINKYGRKIKGIKATLYYYFEILGNEPVNIMLLSKIVNEQYENARLYLEKTKKIQEYNAQVDLNAGTFVYTISDKYKGKKKPQKRIEDL